MMYKTLKLSRIPFVGWLMGNRYVKFGVVGFSGTVVNLFVLYISQEFIFAQIKPEQKRLTLSLATAIILATLNNFLWNRIWTWGDRKHKIKKDFFVQLGQYFLACWFSILLQFGFVKILANLFHYLIANIFAIVIASLINFLLNDSFTFSVKKSTR